MELRKLKDSDKYTKEVIRCFNRKDFARLIRIHEVALANKINVVSRAFKINTFRSTIKKASDLKKFQYISNFYKEYKKSNNLVNQLSKSTCNIIMNSYYILNNYEFICKEYLYMLAAQNTSNLTSSIAICSARKLKYYNYALEIYKNAKNKDLNKEAYISAIYSANELTNYDLSFNIYKTNRVKAGLNFYTPTSTLVKTPEELNYYIQNNFEIEQNNQHENEIEFLKTLKQTVFNLNNYDFIKAIYQDILNKNNINEYFLQVDFFSDMINIAYEKKDYLFLHDIYRDFTTRTVRNIYYFNQNILDKIVEVFYRPTDFFFTIKIYQDIMNKKAINVNGRDFNDASTNTYLFTSNFFTTAINAAYELKNNESIENIYRDIRYKDFLNNKLFNIDLFTKTIELIDKSKENYQFLHNAYKEVKDIIHRNIRLLNFKHFTNITKFAYQSKDFLFINEIYNDVRDSINTNIDLFTPEFFFNIIQSVYKSENVQLQQRIYEDIININERNNEFFTNVIKIAYKSNKNQLIGSIYQDIIKINDNIFTTNIFSIVIFSTFELKNYSFVYRIYRNAFNQNRLNTIIFHNRSIEHNEIREGNRLIEYNEIREGNRPIKCDELINNIKRVVESFPDRKELINFLVNLALNQVNPALNQVNPVLNQANLALNQVNPALNQEINVLNQVNPVLNQANLDFNQANQDFNQDFNPEYFDFNQDFNPEYFDFNQENPDSSQENPALNQENPALNQENPALNQANPDSSQANSDSSQANPDLNQANPDSSQANLDLNQEINDLNQENDALNQINYTLDLDCSYYSDTFKDLDFRK